MIRIRRGAIGVEFATKIINRDDPDNPITQSLADFRNLYIILRRTDGLEITLPAEPRDESNLSNTEIVYTQDPSTETHFPADSPEGFWTFRGAVRYLDGSYFESYDSVELAIV